MAEIRQIAKLTIHFLGDNATQLAKDLREPTSRVSFYRGARASRGLY